MKVLLINGSPNIQGCTAGALKIVQEQLSAANRELITLAALASLSDIDPQLTAHQKGAVNMGNTQEQVHELIAYLSAQGLSLYDHAAEANAGRWTKGNPNTSYAKFFTGNSYLSTITPQNLSPDEKTILPLSNVTFEPGCRNNWHIHHGTRQILICVSDRGWYQEREKKPLALHTGDVIDIPEGVKHWHGAQVNCWFQHLVTHIRTTGEESNEWLESLDDEYYHKLNHENI